MLITSTRTFPALIMLLLPQISCLKSTWELLAQNQAELCRLYRSKLTALYRDLNGAAGSLPLHNITVPHIVPFLRLMEATSPDDPHLTDLDLDSLLGHLDIARFIAEQCPMYQAASRKFLSSVRPQRELLDIFRTETHLKLLWGAKGSKVTPNERYPKMQQLLTVLANRVEPSEVAS